MAPHAFRPGMVMTNRTKRSLSWPRLQARMPMPLMDHSNSLTVRMFV